MWQVIHGWFRIHRVCKGWWFLRVRASQAGNLLSLVPLASKFWVACTELCLQLLTSLNWPRHWTADWMQCLWHDQYWVNHLCRIPKKNVEIGFRYRSDGSLTTRATCFTSSIMQAKLKYLGSMVPPSPISSSSNVSDETDITKRRAGLGHLHRAGALNRSRPRLWRKSSRPQLPLLRRLQLGSAAVVPRRAQLQLSTLQQFLSFRGQPEQPRTTTHPRNRWKR